MKTEILGNRALLIDLVAGRLAAMSLQESNATLVVVPTAESRRSLQEHLLTRAPHGVAVLPEIITPTQWAGMLMQDTQPIVTQSIVLATWIAQLRAEADLSPLVTRSPSTPTFEWLMHLAESCIQAERRLALAGIALDDMLALLQGSTFEHQIPIWQKIQQIKSLVLKNLPPDVAEPTQCLLDWGRAPYIPAAFTRISNIIVAGCPDFPPIFSTGLAQLEQQETIALHYWAASNNSHCITPTADAQHTLWRATAHIPQETYINWQPEAGEVGVYPDTTTAMLGLKQFLQDKSNTDCALVICDPQFLRSTQDALIATSPQESTWLPSLTTGITATLSPIAHLLRALNGYLEHPADLAPWASVQPFIRSTLLAQMLGLDSLYSTIFALCQVQAQHIPTRAHHATKWLNRLAANTRTPEDKQTYLQAEQQFGKTMEWLSTWADAPSVGQRLITWHQELTELMTQMDTHSISQALLNHLALVATTIADLEERHLITDPSHALPLAYKLFTQKRFSPERQGTHIDIISWQDLAFCPAPHLVLIGFHEGAVPDNHFADTFLPDALCEHIPALSTHTRRMARDGMLLQQVLESRRLIGGSTHLMLIQRSAGGDVCQPSSLLLRCADADLPPRVTYLFTPRPSTAQPATFVRGDWVHDSHGQLPNWRQKLLKGERVSLSPSLLKRFLECPRRFWLESIAPWEALDLDVAATPAEFGSIIHEVLLQAFSLQSETQIPHTSTAQEIETRLHSLCKLAFAQQFGDTHSLPQAIKLQDALARLSRLALDQYKLFRAGWRVLATEIKVKDWAPWPDRPEFVFNMKIDRIDIQELVSTTQDGRSYNLRIYDYKTKASDTTPQKSHLRAIRNESQLAQLESALRPTPPQGIHFDTFKEQKKPDTTGVESVPLPFRWTDLQLPLYESALNHILNHRSESLSAEWKRVIAAVPSDDYSIQTAYFLLPPFGRGGELVPTWNMSKIQFYSTYVPLLPLPEHALDCARYIAELMLNGGLQDFPAAEQLGWVAPQYSPITAIAPDGAEEFFKKE